MSRALYPTRRQVLQSLALAGSALLTGCGDASSGAKGGKAKRQILNVSYDPTRELYLEYNAAFAEHWLATTGEEVVVRQSHGGSGKQARAVIDGLDADIVTLALSLDIDEIAERTGRLPKDWASRMPHRSSPYTSTIVFLVRQGNPKGIKDWADLARDGVQIITPNPKTGGGARWNYLAAWAWATNQFSGDDGRIRDYMRRLVKNVAVFDSGARGSTTTFAQRNIGDVFLSWENEAFLALKEFGSANFEIVVPSLSILAEPPVAWLDANVQKKGNEAVARAYSEYLFSPVGQKIVAKNFFRPVAREHAAPEDLARFLEVKMVTIEEAFGGWPKAQATHFAEGAIFDQLQR